MPRTASLPGSNSESIRRDNLSAVLREVHISGPRSRSEIVSLTGLNRTADAGRPLPTAGDNNPELVHHTMMPGLAPTARTAGATAPDVPFMLDPWVRVVHQESERTGTHWRQQHYTVDFVHRSYLTIYLTQHLLPFAEELARRFQEGRHKFAKSVPARAKHLSWAQFIGR